jgi:hypothetical protein
MLIIIKIKTFFIDIIKAQKNYSYTGDQTTWNIIRYLYYISDGLLLKFIESFLIKKKNFFSRSFFKKNPTYKILNKINEDKLEVLRKEILEIKTATGKNKESLRFVDNNSKNLNSLDFNYYEKKKIIRLNFDNGQLIQNVKIASFIKDFLSLDFIKTIEDFSGCKLHLMGINSWLTLPIPSEQIQISSSNYDSMTSIYDAQQWHRDCDNFRDIKIFIYLTDVNKESDGCFQIINNSNNFSFFSPFKYYNYKSLRVPNKIITNKYKLSIHSFFGNKGTCFIADTRALHRGLAITQKKQVRFILELYFSNHLLGKDKKLEIKTEHASFDIWKEMVNKNYELFSTVFKKETLINFK